MVPNGSMNYGVHKVTPVQGTMWENSNFFVTLIKGKKNGQQDLCTTHYFTFSNKIYSFSLILDMYQALLRCNIWTKLFDLDQIFWKIGEQIYKCSSPYCSIITGCIIDMAAGDWCRS